MMEFSRQSLSRIENLLILLLSCSALILLSQTTMVQGNAQNRGNPGGTEAMQTMALSKCAPVAMVYSENNRRVGAITDGSAAILWREAGLEAFLNQLISASKSPVVVTVEDWQETILREGNWVYFDFLYDVPFSDDSESGMGRRFFVPMKGNRPSELYYYCERDNQYYACHLSGAVSALPDVTWPQEEGNPVFAFEEPDITALLPNQILTDGGPQCPCFGKYSPLSELNWDLQSKLLEGLGFHVQTVSVYQSVEGPVFRDGDDTLRFQTDGTISYHTTETSSGRYCALSDRYRDLQRTAETILEHLFGSLNEEGNLYCSERILNEDGSVTLIYEYRIGDTEALLSSNGAEFTFLGAALVNFEIHAVCFTETEYVPPILPIRQAAAVLSATGQTGHELQLCYQIRDGIMQADWVLRMEES